MLWHSWRRRICARIEAVPADIPTPAALWRLLHDGDPPPRGATWADTLVGATASRLVEAIGRTREPGPGEVAIWNVRWLTNPRTEKAKGKRAQLLRLTDRGAVAMIQETHWDGEAAATWGSGILPHVEVVRSLACAGPQGGAPRRSRHPLPRACPRRGAP